MATPTQHQSDASAYSKTVAEPVLEPDRLSSKPHSRVSQLLGIFGKASIDYERSLNHQYPGTGEESDPFLVGYLPDDPQDALNMSRSRKWFITGLQAVVCFAVTFASSAYAGGVKSVVHSFDASHEVVTLGVSLYVLGFAIGPLLWAPLSELYGRQRIFIITFTGLTAFLGGASGAPSIRALLVFRFFAGASGASCMTNGPGVIADMFSATERGLATSVLAMAPFLGPALGPMLGGFLGQAEGWRWLEGLMGIFAGACLLFGSALIPETYAPVLLRRRAEQLSKLTGKVYISTLDAGKPPASLAGKLKIALTRPWVLLFREPIVLVSSIYISIIYGTLYLNFAAYPIVFQELRGWSVGIGGLAFTGTAIGVVVATLTSILDNKHYVLKQSEAKGNALPPESRLYPAIVGSIFIPTGLFWFAWTCGPDRHWAIPIVGSAFFSCGLVMVFMSLLNYLIDSYVVFAASVIAANSVLRSLFGAAFPLFTRKMYDDLGIHWAGSIPAFLALACVPFPILFFKFGSRIRMKCKYTAEAAQILQRMRAQYESTTEDDAKAEPSSQR